MKKGAVERNFKKMKNQIHQIDEIARHTRIGALWEQEASVRKKIKTLREFKNEGFKDYKRVYDSYLEILEYMSVRLVEDYNRKNNTDFDFHEIAGSNYSGYLKSGIVSVLITEHIPAMIHKEFDAVFPENPKNEYEEARRFKRKAFLHLGETNTGKTYNAMQKLKQGRRGIYLSPLRILALENFQRLNEEGVKCSLVTGEEEIIVEGATHVSCTIEKLDVAREYDVAVIDEIQMIGDDQRGAAWTRALLGLKCREIHICGAYNAKGLLVKILEDCHDEYEIKEYSRDVPLEIEQEDFHYKDVQDGDALVAFSKKRVLQLAHHYADMGIKASLIYGDLPPEVRRTQYEQFINKENKLLITTDAIGMGVNLPIRRIVFMDVKKFDGNEVRLLNSQEVKQIAGRAGRKGIYDKGYVTSYGNNQNFIREMVETEDRVIAEAVTGPSDAILKVKRMSLREKLALWITREEKVPFYRKMDVGEKLIVLDAIRGCKLDERTQWELLRIPFDATNDVMMSAFLFYVDQLFVAKSAKLSKPSASSAELRDLELYYQKVNLYYSFSKVFNLEFDEQWVYEERTSASLKINKALERFISER